MSRRLAACVLLLALLAPAASAFSSARDELYVAYAAADAPMVLASGALALAGETGGGLLVAGSAGSRLGAIPSLEILEGGNAPRAQTVRGASLEIESGAFLWSFPEGGAAGLDLAAPYGVALALPEAPVPAGEGGAPGAGFLLASERFGGSARWPGGEASIVPLDAVVTIRDARGEPLEGWHSRRVNAEAAASQDLSQGEVAFAASGAFSAQLAGEVVAGAAGSPAALTLSVGPASQDRFAPTLEVLQHASAGLVGQGGGEASPLAALGQASGILNGALLVVPGVEAGGAPARVARLGDEAFALGPLSIVRGEGLEVAWREDEMRLQGDATVALGRDGFAVDEPRTIGLFPVVSVLLWAVALAAVAFFFVRRPPTGRHDWPMRMMSLALNLVVLLAVLYFWDRSFEQTFGTSVVGILREDGLGADTLSRVGVVAALELMPWGVAALLFALPVRIALGVGLRYLGRGKSFKGIANAGGLVALGVLGPLYALWCFNLVWQQASKALGG